MGEGQQGQQGAPPEGGSTEGTENSEPKVFDADYVAKLRQENARYRNEAKANADAAKRLADIEEANKTEQQKIADRLAEAEKAAADARAEALRFKIASKFGVSDEDADLFLTGTDEDTLTKQAERLAGHVADRRKQGPRVPKEGTNNSQPKDDDERAFVRGLFGAG